MVQYPLPESLPQAEEKPRVVWRWTHALFIILTLLAAFMCSGCAAISVIIANLYTAEYGSIENLDPDRLNALVEDLQADPIALQNALVELASTPNFTISFLTPQLAVMGLGLLILALRKGGFSSFGLVPTQAKWLWRGALIAIPLIVIRICVVVVFLAPVALTGNVEDLASVEDLEALGQTLTPSGSVASVLLVIVLVSVVVQILEEMMFRGVIFRWLRNGRGFWFAAILSSIAFGLAHLNPLLIVSTFILGLAAAWLLDRSESLWPPIILHMVTNFVAQGLGYLALLGPTT